jgi:hypothetical protein
VDNNKEFFMNGVKGVDNKTGETVLGYVLKPIHFQPCKWVSIGNNLVKDIFNML